jgi:NAD(P)-dependent dehydrogenase (short-subunit alcohol dehydrogenase family)
MADRVPGRPHTRILGRAMPKPAAGQSKAEMTERNPMQRFGRPDEVAKAVAFLAFDATYTTGSGLAVRGATSQL